MDFDFNKGIQLFQDKINVLLGKEKKKDNRKKIGRADTLTTNEVKLATEKQLSEIRNFTGKVLTEIGIGSSIEGTEEQRKHAAYLDNGVLVIDANKKNDITIRTLKNKIRDSGNRINEEIYVELSIIREIYDSFKRRAADVNALRSDNANKEFFYNIVRRAAAQNASDIHIKISKHEAEVRLRIDGDLGRFGQQVPAEKMRAVLRAIYTASEGGQGVYQEFDFQEARLSADKNPAFPANVNAIRLQFNPFLDGRHFVGRILYNSQKVEGDVDKLGYAKSHMKNIRAMRKQSYGINIIAGPTGSGKSTTLQRTLIAKINEEEGRKNTLTIEDPPEYEIPGAIQLPVIAKDSKEKAEANARAIKAAMRSDPDTIMIGEVRDKESASLAIEASMTGHQVWCSVHANTAIGIIDRFRKIGISMEDMLDHTLVTGLIAQRLIKLLCPHCSRVVTGNIHTFLDKWLTEKKEDGTPVIKPNREGMLWTDDIDFREILEEPLFKDEEMYQGMRLANISENGCGHEKCRGGYAGRTVIGETICPDMRFMSLMKDEKFLAYEYWTARKDFSLPKKEQGMGGFNMTDHIIAKVLNGQGDIRQVGMIEPLSNYRFERLPLLREWIKTW